MEQQAVQNNYLEQHDTKVVLTIKYKIYIVILIIVMAATRGYMNKSVAKHKATQQNIVKLGDQRTQKESEYQQVIKDLVVVKDLNENKASILSCLGTRGCTSFPESLKDVMPQVRAFLQLQKNEGQKMSFDQKKILANINEYLLRSTNNMSNGTVTSIIFGNLTPVTNMENVVMVPITLTVDFADKNGLLSFVYNVENSISQQFPMLYTINSVNYDIVKYQETQTVNIELIGYMIK